MKRILKTMLFKSKHAYLRLRYGKYTPKNFIILFNSRSGSSLLTLLLNQDIRFHTHSEPLIELKTITEEHKFLDAFHSGRQNHSPLFLGMKTKLYQIKDLEYFSSSIKKNNTTIVVCRRRNYLKQSLSLYRMHTLLQETEKKYGKGLHNVKNKKDIPKASIIDPEAIISTAIRLQQRDKELITFLKKYSIPYNEIFYEDFSDNPAIAIAYFETLFSISLKCNHTHPVKKITPDNIFDVIKNKEEFMSVIKASEFSNMLPETDFPLVASTTNNR